MSCKTFLTVFFALIPALGSAQGVSYTPSQAQADGLKAAAEIGASGAYTPQSLTTNPSAQGANVFGDRYNSNATRNSQGALKSTSSNENLKNFGQTAQDSSVSEIKGNSVNSGSFYSNNIDKQSDEASYFLVTGQKGDPLTNQSEQRTGAFNVQSIKAKEISAGTGKKPLAQSSGLVTGMGSNSSMQCSSNNTTFATNAESMTCTSLYQPHDTWCKQNLEVKIIEEDVSSRFLARSDPNNRLGIPGYKSQTINWDMSTNWGYSDASTLWSNMVTLKAVNLGLGDYYEFNINGTTILRSNPIGLDKSKTLIGGALWYTAPFIHDSTTVTNIFVDSNNNEYPYYGGESPECVGQPTAECLKPDLDLTNYIKDGPNTLSFACFTTSFTMNMELRKCNIDLVMTGKNTRYSTAFAPGGSCGAIDKLNKPIE